MFSSQKIWLASAVMIALVVVGEAKAAQPTPTVVTLAKMCPTCAKSIMAKLQKIPGVQTVESNHSQKTLTVIPKPSVALSPRALWETIEGGGEQPIHLAGPSGVFRSKPNF